MSAAAATTNGNGADITRHTPLDALPELLTPDEVRAFLGVGRNTVYEMLRRNEIRSVRLGRLIRIPRTVLEELARP